MQVSSMTWSATRPLALLDAQTDQVISWTQGRPWLQQAANPYLPLQTVSLRQNNALINGESRSFTTLRVAN